MRLRVILLLLPALALVLFSAGGAVAAPPASTAPMGIVLQASHAHVASSDAQSGATVYDGDLLETLQHGTLQVRFGGSQAYLLPESKAVVQQMDAGFGATLTGGAVLLSSIDGSTFRLLADGATIQPATSRRTVAQVSVINSKELLLLASKGSLQVTMGDESKTLPEGGSVRMLIQPGQPAASPAPQVAAWSPTVTYAQGDEVSYNGVLYVSQANNNLGNQPGGRSSLWNRRRGGAGRGAAGGPGAGGQNNFLWVAIGLVGVGVATALALALITNDAP